MSSVVVVSAAAATTALLVYLRRTRKLGFSLGVRFEVLGTPDVDLLDEPTEEWLDEVREVGLDKSMAFLTPLEELLGTRPKWATKAATLICDDVIRSSQDTCLIKVRAFLPRVASSRELLPICVYFHGGGWVHGGSGSHDHVARYFAAHKVVTVMVDYRLSPENKYPIPLHDCVDALKWAARNASELGCDPRKLIVAGDSAGANLALAACLKVRDTKFEGFAEGVNSIAGMLLAYPCLSRELASLDGGSYAQFANGYGLTRKRMQWFWEQYTGCKVDAKIPADELRYIAPIDTRTSLHALPPTKLLLADHDVLYDDGKQLAGRLRSAGVHVTVLEVPYTLHGSFANRRVDLQAWQTFMESSVSWVHKCTES
ncbi:Alpha/Beta hydrolase protein [Pavlovales sp. CCMP2436]|nr:Alpha/Beta hydrolase protein [Pavlovales sp. CCMP2436]|mmetsp:Transcript_4456/g.11403  ORF Transcript_4456/g.11403 Transcript_4456/m.11403 type:complete len:371 (-) Transcript_4456:163-1275(-)